MKQSLFKALNIREEEAPLVFRLLLLQFSLGLATSFLITASYSFLLYKYNIQQVPLVYVAVALILFPINGVYVRLDLKMSARKLLELVIAVALFTIPVWLAVWQTTKAPWVPMIIVAWNVSIYMLVGYAYWGMASLLFNVRESRRIFSVIGSGDLPAKILGYWAISFLSPMVGIEGTMLFSLVFYALAFVITRVHFANGKIDWETFESHQHVPAEHHIQRHDKWWMRIFETPLILRIAILSMLAYAVMHLSEFTFLSEIKSRFDSSSDLLKFISIFFAIARMLALFFKLLFSSRIIAALGLTRSLMFTPLIILLMAVSIVLLTFSGADPKLNLYAFGIMFMISELLRSVIQEPSFFILFQPLNIHLRLKGHVVAKGYVYPPVLFVLGLSLWWWMNQYQSVSILLVLTICIAIIAVWIVIIPFIAQSYQKAVELSIQKGFFSGVALFLNSDNVVKLLLEKITFGKEEEKIHALHLLRKSGYAGLEKLVVALLPGAAKNLKTQLLGIIGESNFKSAIPALHSMYGSETDPKIKSLLFRTLCLTDPLFLNTSIPQFKDLNTDHKKSVLESLHQQKKQVPQELFDHILMKSYSDESSLSLLLEVIHFANKDWQSTALSSLFQSDLPVPSRRKLLFTAGKLELTVFLPTIVESLNDRNLSHAAKDALVAFGDAAFQHLAGTSTADDLNELATKNMIDAAQHVKTSSSRAFLLKLFEQQGPWHEKVINAMWKQALVPSAEDRHRLNQYINELLQSAADKMELLQRIKGKGGDESSFLKNAIYNEVQSDTFSALKLIAITHGHDYVQRVMDLVQSKQFNMLHNAIELLDITLPKHYFTQLQTLIDFIAEPKASTDFSKPQIQKNEIDSLLKSVLEKSDIFNAWTRSLAWYMAAKHDKKELLEKIALVPGQGATAIEIETKQFVHLTISKG